MIRKKTNTRPGWSDNMLFNKTVAGKLTNKKSTEKRKTNLANNLIMDVLLTCKSTNLCVGQRRPTHIFNRNQPFAKYQFPSPL
jgi:hypothetical protein